MKSGADVFFNMVSFFLIVFNFSVDCFKIILHIYVMFKNAVWKNIVVTY